MSKKSPKSKEPVDPFFALVAKVYGVPQTGITAIDKQPYLNKDGRIFLLKSLCTGEEAVKAIRVEFIRVSTSLMEPAVAKKTIVFKDGTEIEGIGEASKDNVGKSSIQQTLNMMAETRALNRAIWQAIGAKIMEKVQEATESMDGITDEQKQRLLEAGRSSYEEMDRPSNGSETSEEESQSGRMYKAAIDRLEKIKADRKQLKTALKKLKTWPGLEASHKALIEEKIYIHLSKIAPEKKEKKKTAKKVAGKKKEKVNL